MSYPTVTIGSHPYNVYADQEQADLYEDASISAQGAAWREANNDMKARALVSGTRWLDSVLWQGTKTYPDQELQFPRIGLESVASDELPTQLISACIELASYLVEDNDARAVLSTPMIKTMSAGRGTFLTYFRPEGDVQVQTPFPPSVMAYVSQWLGGAVGPNGADSFDTCGKSKLLDDKYDFSHGI